MLRHTFCSHMAIRRAAARAIQVLAGHSKLTTTERYMHLTEKVLEDTIELLEPPSGGNGVAAESEAISRVC